MDRVSQLSYPSPLPRGQRTTCRSFWSAMSGARHLLLVLLLPALCVGQQSDNNLTLQPPTPDKEVFTGDSFVITCLANEPPSAEYKLKWLNPSGKDVPSVPTSPVYVSEKLDGLQIVFLRHKQSHSGIYKCVKVKTDSGAAVSFIDFKVKIYKSIEFTGESRAEAVEGETFQLSCNVRFDPDVNSASVVWDKTGQNIVNENSDKYRVSETRPPNTKSTLSIVSVNKSDAGTYVCRATQFTSTISQFKQHEIDLKVNYRPKFTRKTLGGVWIDRREITDRGKKVIDVNFTCEVEAEPRAEFMWHDERTYIVDLKSTPGIIDIVNQENLSVLKYRYNVTGKETEAAAAPSNWPPSGTSYRPPQRHVLTQPNVKFECRVRNAISSDSKTLELKIGDLPLPPSLVSHSYNGSELTLVLRQPPVDPPVDFYRLEFKSGVNVDFNGPAGQSTGRGQESESNNESNTYTIALDNVPSGNHPLVIYAHNPVGWSSVLRPPGVKIHVVNRAGAGVHASLSIVVLSLLSALLFASDSSSCRRAFSFA